MVDDTTSPVGNGPDDRLYFRQLLSGRDFAKGDVMARQMVNFVYLIGDRETGEHPVALREAVTSPAGTTIAAIRELENHGVRAAFLSALEAARDRSRELAQGQ